MGRPVGALSLDLDNKWSYLKIRGIEEWRDYPSYLPEVVPLVGSFLDERQLRITVFVVGKDAEFPENRSLLQSLAGAGHELGNHSFRHEPWLHLYGDEQAADEIERSTAAIREASGVTPVGFRGPGYSISPGVLGALVARDYVYDATVLPTWIGPLARAYYLRTSGLSSTERTKRGELFGRWRDGLAPNRAHLRTVNGARLVEIPVTTMPFLKVPIHFSYLHQLAGFSERLAGAYLETALRMCALVRVGPSILLHPLDFLGQDDVEGLGFFPTMQQEGAEKRRRLSRFLDHIEDRFELGPLLDYARQVADAGTASRT